MSIALGKRITGTQDLSKNIIINQLILQNIYN